MNANSALQKLHRLTWEKETQRSEHRREEEAKVLRKKNEMFKRGENARILNNQPLAMRSPSIHCHPWSVRKESNTT